MKRTMVISNLAALAIGYANAPSKRVEPIIATGEAPKGFTPPPKPSRGGGSEPKYPFADLEPDQFFSVKNKTRRQMAGPIGSAHKRYTDEMKDASGKVVNTSRSREFYATDVDAETAKKLKGTPHEGATVLVVRSK